MSKRPFTKPATTFAQQIDLLRGRGMIIADPVKAEFYLSHLNYYRLGAYWLPFEANHSTHTFQPGTRFEDVLDLYIFDRELRLLVMDVIERVEVSVRTQWAYQLAHHHGAHACLDPNLVSNWSEWIKDSKSLQDSVHRSRETFIQHLRNNYHEPLPPTWALCEVMSLGQLSRCFGNLAPKATRRAIALPYSLDDDVLESWLHHLTFVRNICAHHSRLWNRELTITPQLPRSKPHALVPEFVPGSRRLYNTLVILVHMMDAMAPGHHWRKRLKDLLAAHHVNLTAMDFPADWAARAIWQEVTP